MAWYVIQTYTGGEEKLAEMIRRIVPGQYYGECFVAYSEQLRHRQHENQIHVLRLFPGYLFISSDDIEQLFRYLKKVPAMSKIMAADDFVFTPLWEGEAEFLLNIMDEDHIVRLSYVATDGRDHITYLSGPLERCREQLHSWHFRKRYAAVRLQLDGREKEAKLGIILNDDIRREITYGKIEAVVESPETYNIWWEDRLTNSTGTTETESGKGKVEAEGSAPDQAGKRRQVPQGEYIGKDMQKKMPEFRSGDRVLVMEGAFEGSMALVAQARKETLKISVQMFGRELLAEVHAGSVRKIEDGNTDRTLTYKHYI